MTVGKKKNDIPVDESQIGNNVQLTSEEEIVKWRDSTPTDRTRTFIRKCRKSKSDFIDTDFLEHAKDWIDLLLQYEDSFCGEHAQTTWDTHCRNFLRDVLDKEGNAEMEKVVNDGATQGSYTFTHSDSSETVNNFSWTLWMLGLAERPSTSTTEENIQNVTLINQGKLVFTQLKNQRTIMNIVLIERAEIDYSLTVNNVTGNKGSNISVGASEHASVTQTIEQE